MTKDLRDPKVLGELLLYVAGCPERRNGESLSDVADLCPLEVRDYSSNLGPIEKYGDPTKLPSTLPN